MHNHDQTEDDQKSLQAARETVRPGFQEGGDHPEHAQQEPPGTADEYVADQAAPRRGGISSSGTGSPNMPLRIERRVYSPSSMTAPLARCKRPPSGTLPVPLPYHPDYWVGLLFASTGMSKDAGAVVWLRRCRRLPPGRGRVGVVFSTSSGPRSGLDSGTTAATILRLRNCPRQGAKTRQAGSGRRAGGEPWTGRLAEADRPLRSGRTPGRSINDRTAERGPIHPARASPAGSSGCHRPGGPDAPDRAAQVLRKSTSIGVPVVQPGRAAEGVADLRSPGRRRGPGRPSPRRRTGCTTGVTGYAPIRSDLPITRPPTTPAPANSPE